MQVTIDRDVLKELRYIVHVHRMHGAANPFDNVEGLVAYVLASVADGSRRPGAWERSMLDSMGLVAYSGEHEQYRAAYGDPTDREDVLPMPAAAPAPASSSSTAEPDDPAIVDIVQLLFRAVAALRNVLTLFDTSEYRNPERWPRESAALQEVYRALGKPWPADAPSADE
jgi:hypothetical protein